MARLARLIIFLLVIGGVWFWYTRPVEVKTVAKQDLWYGEEESGCMFPLSAINNGQNPMPWTEKRPRWNQFPSKQNALEAGYRECEDVTMDWDETSQ